MILEFLFSLNETTLILLTICFYIAAFGQTYYALQTAFCETDDRLSGVVLYEFLLAFHLVLACAVANSAHFNYGEILYRIKLFSVPIEPLLWLNLVIFSFGVFLAIKHKKPIMSLELVMVLMCTPPVIALCHSYSWVLLCMDCSFFIFRISSSLALGFKRQSLHLSRLSPGEAIKKLPEGVLYSSKRKGTLLMNDTMRRTLMNLGIKGHLFVETNVWDDMINCALNEYGIQINRDSQSLTMRVAPGDIRQFMRREVTLHGVKAVQIVAVDVTEQEELNESIRHANLELEASNVQLKEALQEIELTAQRDAENELKLRVHEEIGHRMSILHRYLESGIDNPQAVERISQLVTSITSSFSEHEDQHGDPLSSLIDAFSLVNVSIHLSGNFPRENPSFPVFVAIVRESSLNALKHANAKNVYVEIMKEGNFISISIYSDGNFSGEAVFEGTGIQQMRSIVKSVGGSFEISSLSPFTVVVKLLANEVVE